MTQFSGTANYYLNKISQNTFMQNVGSGVPMNEASAIWTSSPATGTSETFALNIADVDTFPYFCYDCWYYLTVECDNPIRTQFKVQYT